MSKITLEMLKEAVIDINYTVKNDKLYKKRLLITASKALIVGFLGAAIADEVDWLSRNIKKE